jgi:hypothetical protein
MKEKHMMKTVNFLMISALLLLNASSIAFAEYSSPEEHIKPIAEHPEKAGAPCPGWTPMDPRCS